VSPEALDSLRRAGRIAAQARDKGAARIIPGARLREVCEGVEDEIRRLGGSPAFPAQSSLNHLAAHYCPAPDDETTYSEGDLAKLDVGVHVNGYVVDTATTVNVGDRPENRPFVEAAAQALEAAIRTARPGIEIREVSAVIEGTVRSYGLRPMKSLCGHGVGKWTVHCPPPIPNAPDDSYGRFSLDAVLAFEPFATDGKGFVREEGEPQVFRLPSEAPSLEVDYPEILEAIRLFRGLPFARRHLLDWPLEGVEETLGALRRARQLQTYPPLAEDDGRRVAQAEHTVWMGAEGVEVLTR
jgi:methionyl aminopeptidase